MTETTFKQAYGTLLRHSEALRNQREPNIDDLLTVVTESVDAYRVEHGLHPQAVAVRASAHRGVERKQPWLQLGQ